MSKHLWGTVYNLQAAERSPGDGISRDFFGFYIEKHKLQVSDVASASGAQAEEIAEAIDRRRINEGEDIVGEIARCKVKHVNLLVFRHKSHGICIYVDELTTYADNKAAILTDGAKTRILASRNDFFGSLDSRELLIQEIEDACRAYLKVHIQMDRS